MDALKAKLYAQVMLGRHDDALQLIQASESIASEVQFERAYCLFKTGRLDAALKLLQGADDEAALHLCAIIHMRQKHSEAASEVYTSLAPRVKGNKQAAVELVSQILGTCLQQ
jgi:tetratricopeptide (TPR) repeat protein